MRSSIFTPARIGCLTLLSAVMACSDSGGPPSPPVIEASSTTTQTANAGAVVTSPSVRVGREDGTPIAKAVVTFAVTGGATIAATVDTTDSQGIASAGIWRLGNTPATSTVTATTTKAPGQTVVFTATGNVGPAASIAKTAGDNQFRQPGQPASPLPSVTVRDAAGNGVAGVTVTFAVTAGGGSATGLVQTTDATGVATVGSWTLGTAAGQNRMTATVAGIAAATFTQTVVAPAFLNLRAGDNQNAQPGANVTAAPSVTVLDNLNAPAEGVTVTFSIASGNGSVTGGTVQTNAQGVATVGSWQLGDLGDNTLVAVVEGLTPITFRAVASGYNIELRYRSAITARQRLAFERAVLRWSRVITGDQANVALNIAADTTARECYPAMNETIDDLIIYVELSPIDGVGSVLGQAGPCLIRSTARLTLVGTMQFDNADIANMENNNTLDDVILHEMGHVIGIGTLWDQPQLGNLLVGKGTADPYFTGTNARAAFAAAGGGVYAGNPVPVENSGGAGTRDGHWREVTMGSELMTGFVSAAGNPMSAVTIASLQDMGYVVNANQADAYAVPGSMAIVGEAPREGIQIRDILLTNPEVVGEDGRIIRR